MELNKEEFWEDKDQSKQENDKPNARRVDDDNLDEEDLERDLFVSGDERMPVREGKAMGGESFGENNITPAGNDKNNPPKNAGNPIYYSGNLPLEEHPEDTNFEVKEQDGSPAINGKQASSSIQNEEPKPERPEERGNGENDRPHEDTPYQEGTADSDKVNIPGPDELPDQQKVGEDVDDDTFERDHIET